MAVHRYGFWTMQCSSYFRTIDAENNPRSLNDIWLFYLDDAMVMAKSFDGMLDNLHKIFVRIRNANLKLNKKNVLSFNARLST